MFRKQSPRSLQINTKTSGQLVNIKREKLKSAHNCKATSNGRIVNYKITWLIQEADNCNGSITTKDGPSKNDIKTKLAQAKKKTFYPKKIPF